MWFLFTCVSIILVKYLSEINAPNPNIGMCRPWDRGTVIELSAPVTDMIHFLYSTKNLSYRETHLIWSSCSSGWSSYDPALFYTYPKLSAVRKINRTTSRKKENTDLYYSPKFLVLLLHYYESLSLLYTTVAEYLWRWWRWEPSRKARDVR